MHTTETTTPSDDDDIRRVLQDELIERVLVLLRRTRTAALALQVPNTNIYILAGHPAEIREMAPDVITMAAGCVAALEGLTRYRSINGEDCYLAVDIERLMRAGCGDDVRNAAPSNRFEIGPVPVERDENGWWSHPGIPNFDEDHKSFSAWVKAVGLEVKYKCLESYPEHPLYDAWFDRGECNASIWEPEAPAGEGWFTFSIHDTEDGPVWAWARRATAQRASDANGGEHA